MQDLRNADCILIMGSNMAEAHPVAFRFVVAAREQGATVLHVDPRYTRTSALADLHVPLRPGSDIAFLGGLIRHVLEGGHAFIDYVRAYTNAAFVVREEFRDTEDLDGLYSGFDPEAARYDAASWDFLRDADGRPVRDETLAHPRCVWQLLRRHFARYTPEVVAEICGMPAEMLERVARALVENSGRERTSTICYAVGWTQHTKGVQNIRAAAILQLLLGNVGRPGGGILALRGHANIQGATDLATLYHVLPGYLPAPRAGADGVTLADYLAANRRGGAWSRLPAFVVSQLKAWFGAAATRENDFGHGWLPRATGDHSFQAMFEKMSRGGIDGFVVIGQNPAVGAPNAQVARAALAKLRWLVVRDYFELETAAFWKPEAGVDPTTIDTEVFLMPAASSFEKDGSLTNTQRLVQWHDRAVPPPGDARSDLHFIWQLGRRLKARATERDRDAPLRALTWDYPADSAGAPSAEAVLREINGFEVATGRHVASPDALCDDGSTACGSWIHAGIFPAPGDNRAASRRRGDGPYDPGWGFAWPQNRRILYNRASADPDGRPWSERKRLLAWDEATGRFGGNDVPDFDAAAPPRESAMRAFVMLEDGVASLFAAKGLADGPLPAHYEPIESPVRNRLYGRQRNPAAKTFLPDDAMNRLAAIADQRYPIVLTTNRLTEHHLTGVMTRWLPWLAELVPELFVEIGVELARERGIANGDRVVVATPRGEVRAKALVTPRMRPLRTGGKRLHVAALPWCFGFQGLVTGDVVNDLTSMVGDPNVGIQETKALLCDVRRA